MLSPRQPTPEECVDILEDLRRHFERSKSEDGERGIFNADALHALSAWLRFRAYHKIRDTNERQDDE